MFTYVHFGPLRQQIGEHVRLTIIGGYVDRIALAHLGIHVKRLRVADRLHLCGQVSQVGWLDGFEDFGRCEPGPCLRSSVPTRFCPSSLWGVGSGPAGGVVVVVEGSR